MKLPDVAACQRARSKGEYSNYWLHPEMSQRIWFRTRVRFPSPPPQKYYENFH